MGIIDKKQVFEAKLALNEFIKDNPRARELQSEIDKALEKAGDNPDNRIAVINQMITEALWDLKEQLDQLSSNAKNLSKEETEDT